MTDDDLLPDREPFPGLTVLADGWKYRDFPWTSKETFDKFMEIIGEENIKWLVFTKNQFDDIRGQCFISPKGFELMIAEQKRLKEQIGE